MDGYKRLGGKNGFFASRNTSFFGILVILVTFFALFYLYYGAASEAAILQREFDAQSEHISKLKNEILESNVNLEKSRSSETACHNAKSIIDTKFEECSTERDKLKAQISDIESSVSEKEESIKSLRKDLTDKANALETDEAKKSAMEKAGVGQEAIIIQLNETLELMKKDLALKENIIHDLKSKIGMNNNITENNNIPQLQEAQTNSTTLASTDNNNNNDENVLVQPNRPVEPEHLSAKDFVSEAKPPPADEPEPKIAEPGKSFSQENQQENPQQEQQPPPKEKEVRNENGEFLGIREPGMRLKMEEAQAQQNEENKENDNNQNSKLINAAKNDENAEN
uniref:Uncharacterized protein n=1 Tax=Panagrolaimus superbus TaxID=310955 RepID=A0A914YK31_9BILA